MECLNWNEIINNIGNIIETKLKGNINKIEVRDLVKKNHYSKYCKSSIKIYGFNNYSS